MIIDTLAVSFVAGYCSQISFLSIVKDVKHDLKHI